MNEIITDALIFDVDGTIWDSTSVSADAWNEALKGEGLSCPPITADSLKKLFGKPMDQILSSVLPDSTDEKRSYLADKIYRIEEEFLEKYPPKAYEGLEEALSRLSAHYPLYVVSNCQKGYIEAMYRATGLSRFFQDKNCYGDTGLYKAENIALMVKKHGLKNPVYIGDTEGDREASEAAHVRFAWCSYGFGTPLSYDFLIESPEMLPSAFGL